VSRSSSFTTPLVVSPLPDGRRWRLVRSFSYHIGSKYSKDIIKVPMGFVTDFASVPQMIIAIIGLICIVLAYYLSAPWLLWLGVAIVLLILSIPYWGKYGKAAVVHDYLYQFLRWMLKQPQHKPLFDRLYYAKDNPRKFADDVFLEAMLVGGTKPWKAKAMYRAVRLVGWLAWH